MNKIDDCVKYILPTIDILFELRILCKNCKCTEYGKYDIDRITTREQPCEGEYCNEAYELIKCEAIELGLIELVE